MEEVSRNRRNWMWVELSIKVIGAVRIVGAVGARYEVIVTMLQLPHPHQRIPHLEQQGGDSRQNVGGREPGGRE